MIKLEAVEAMRAIVIIIIQAWNNGLGRGEAVAAVRTVWTLFMFLGGMDTISLTIKCRYEIKIGVKDAFKFLDCTTVKKKWNCHKLW